MAQRAEAIYQGRTIGIESIYTVIDGKQINIPEKLNWMREKSRNGELYCPCGCGAKLILVAGDRNLREQHFRIKDADTELECTAVTEGKGVSQYFSFATYSCFVGVFKPDRRMFLDALGKCGAAPEETVFIDDSVRNLAGAAELGITPILIAANPAADVETDYLKIRDLRELIRPDETERA